MRYNERGSLWVAAWSEWSVDPNGVYNYPANPSDPNRVECHVLAAREFRGGGMGRDLVREIDVRDPDQFTILGPTVWTDRLGGSAYSDFETDPSTYAVTEKTRYLGFARRENDPNWTTHFEQRDMLGSLTQQTDGSGVFEYDFGYTAFGELLSTFWDIGGPTDPNVGNEPNQPPPTRQMYAGAWQYESDLLYLYGTDDTLPPITLQHVGYRWYQPEIGRFVQRDPIGIGGGLNAYSCCDSEPLIQIDPLGLWPGEGNWYPGKNYDKPGTSGSESFLDRTGGRGHIPGIDYGPTHTGIVRTAEITTLLAPSVACVSVIVAGGKALRAIKAGRIGSYLSRIRKYIRWDRPHHNKPYPHWDGKWFGGS